MAMTGADYETTIFRAVPALLAGSIAGSVVIVVAMAVAGVIDDRTALSLIPGQMFNTAVILAPMVLATFAAGALFIAVPCWWVLHRMGRRTRREAVLLGVVLCGAFGFVPLEEMVSTGDSGAVLEVAAAFAVMAVAGAMAGLTVWRIAYRLHPTSEA